MKTMRKIALVVEAHADDMEYNIGGTIAKLTAENNIVYRAAVTDSPKGTFNPKMTIEKMVKIRRAEALAAGKVLGIKDTFFLGFAEPPTEMDVPAIREALMRLIRKLGINTLFCWDPWASRDDHPDHVITGRCAHWASEFAPFPLFHPEHFKEKGLKPVWVQERYYFSKFPLPDARCSVNIGDFIDIKIKALLKHESQMQLAYDAYVAFQRSTGTPKAKWSRPLRPENRNELMAEAIRREAKENGKSYGLPYAEVFRLVKNIPRYP